MRIRKKEEKKAIRWRVCLLLGASNRRPCQIQHTKSAGCKAGCAQLPGSPAAKGLGVSFAWSRTLPRFLVGLKGNQKEKMVFVGYCACGGLAI